MIVTVTPNPCLDRTAELDAYLVPGAVNRLSDLDVVPAGKGINVALALHRAGADTRAIAPISEHDLFRHLIADLDVPFTATAASSLVRVNLTITSPDGTTTKLNEPGPTATEAQRRDLEDAICRYADHASWIVFAGSLPPGFPTDWYLSMINRLAEGGHKARIAVDTSDGPLRELGIALRAGNTTAPALVAPNSREMHELLGDTPPHLDMQRATRLGDFGPATRAIETVRGWGVEHVLLTLGKIGTMIGTDDGIWYAQPPAIITHSTVGAGDCALAGYLLSIRNGNSPADALADATAYGAAAATMPGTQVPYPSDVKPEHVQVEKIA